MSVIEMHCLSWMLVPNYRAFPIKSTGLVFLLHVSY
jgi:hypothetical protein